MRPEHNEPEKHEIEVSREDEMDPSGSLHLEQTDSETIKEKLIQESEKEVTGDYTEFVEQKKDELENTRKEYIESYKGFLEAKRNNVTSEALEQIKKQLDEERALYLDAKNNYAEALVNAKKAELTRDKTKNDEEIQSEIDTFIRTEIFNDLIVEEEERLQAEKAASYPPKEVGIIRNLYDQWDNLGTLKKTLVTTAIATGIAFTNAVASRDGQSSGIESAGIGLFFAKKFVADLAQDVFSGFVGLSMNNFLTKRIETGHRAQVEELQTTSTLNNLDEIADKYHDLLEQKANKGTTALVVSILSSFASGKALDIGVDFLKNATILKDLATSTTAILEKAPDIMGKVGTTETVAKISSGIFKKLSKLFKLK